MRYTSCLRRPSRLPPVASCKGREGREGLTDEVNVIAVPAHIRPHNQRNEAREEEHEAAAEHVGAVGGGNEAPC